MGGDRTMVGGATDAVIPGHLPSDLYVTLSIVSGPDLGKKFSLLKTHNLIGRNNGDIPLRDQAVSGSHAAVDYVGSNLMLVDMNSTNGTFLNGNKIDKADLNNMDEITIGGTVLVVSVVRDVYGTYGGTQPQVPEVKEFDPNAMTAPRRQLPNPELPAEVQAGIEVIEGPDAGKRVMLKHMSTILGRAEYADIQIKDEAISRRHCQILIKSRDFIGLKDLASANATFLNGRHVSAVQLQNGDIITLGDSKIKFVIK